MSRLALTSLAVTVALICHVSAQTTGEWQDVIRNLRHPNPQTRLDALGRLNGAGYVAAAEAVAPLVADPDDRVQLAAIDTELTFFVAERVNADGNKSRAQRAFDAGPVLRSALPAPVALIDRLTAAMRDENARVRFDAIHALGVIAEPPLPAAQAKALAAELDHYDPTMRAATARVLGRLRVREAGDQLAIALVDSSPIVRLFATEAIGLIRDTRSAGTLRDQLAQTRGDLFNATILALARIGSRDDMGLFRQRVVDKSAFARRAAAEGLGRAGDRDAMPLLESALKGDKADEVQLAAAFGLQELGQVQTHLIAWMMLDSKQAVQVQAQDYLIEVGAPAVPGIQSALKSATDVRHRASLVRMIGLVGTPNEVAALEPLLKDPDERIRRAATIAIARLRRAAPPA